MNERGAILPSIMVFVFLLVVVLLGSVQIYRNQMYQLLATTEMYEAKSMLSFTEREILDRSMDSKSFKRVRLLLIMEKFTSLKLIQCITSWKQ